jgi:acyl carrier protein
MAERADLRRQVLELAGQELSLNDFELARIEDTANLSEHLDSLQVLQLVVAIEDHFRICFEPEDDDTAVTLRDVVAIVERRLAAG